MFETIQDYAWEIRSPSEPPRYSECFGFRTLLRLDTDTGIITTSMVNVCVRMFLEKRDHVLGQFTKSFMQLTVPDEKVELVDTFLTQLYAELERDPMWISKDCVV